MTISVHIVKGGDSVVKGNNINSWMVEGTFSGILNLLVDAGSMNPRKEASIQLHPWKNSLEGCSFNTNSGESIDLNQYIIDKEFEGESMTIRISQQGAEKLNEGGELFLIDYWRG